jgi:hypothetical protein
MLIFAVKKKRTPSIAPKRHSPTVSPMYHSLHLQQAKVRHIFRSLTFQPKLKIGRPNDKYEQEADRVADEVMRMPDPRLQRQVEPEEEEEETLQTKPIANQITPLAQVQRQEEPEEEEEEEAIQTKLADGTQQVQRQEEPEEEEEETLQAKPLTEQITPLVQRQVEPEEEEEEEEAIQTKLADGMQVQRQEEPEEEEEEEAIQTKQVSTRAPAVTPNLASRIQSLQGGGRPMSGSERSFFEPRFSADFSGVKVHTDSNAAHLACSVNAKAFTVGRDVVFGSGKFSPETTGGKKLIAHELTHVVQQNEGPTLFSEGKKSKKSGDTIPNSPELSDKIVPKHVAYLQRYEEKHPTKWAGGDTTTTTDDSYVKINSTAWVKWLGKKNLWSKNHYPINSVYNLGIPFGKWSEVGTWLEIHDHRDFSPDRNEYWKVWVYWPVIKKGNIIGKGGVNINGGGRHAVLTARPILDKAARRLGAEFRMTSKFGRSSEVSLFGTVGSQQTVSGGGFVRTWWLKYELPKVAKRQKINYATSYDIFFGDGSHRILNNYIKGLYKYIFGGAKWSIPDEAKQKVRTGKIEVKVTGYASMPGTLRYNMNLSRERQNKVAGLLRTWLPKAKIVPAALGEFPAQEEGKRSGDRKRYWQRVTVDIDFFLFRE